MRVIMVAAILAIATVTGCAGTSPPGTGPSRGPADAPAPHSAPASPGTPAPTARVIAGPRFFVTPNPHNALSTVVTFDGRGVDSARVVYWTEGEPPRATPFAPARDVARIVVLGLRPSATYSLVLERVRAGGATSVDTLQAATGALPEFLREMHMRVTGGPTHGYTLTAVADTGRTSFVVAFDSTGALRWYREFPGELSIAETKQQPNGDFTVYLGRSPGWMALPGYYEQFRPSGEVTRTIQAPPPLFTDNHELLLTFRKDAGGHDVLDAAHFFSYEHRQADLSRWGGPRDTTIAAHQLLRARPDGSIETVFDGWKHFTWADRIEPPRDTLWDIDHPNALTFDHDSNYIVSWRNMGELTKIDARTGAILWRLGGRHNQFQIRNDPFGGFSAQHSVRVLSNGNLLLYDNGTRHSPPETRAVEYRLDTAAMTADLVWQYRHDPPFWVPYTGSVQRLANGNTVVGFSNRGVVTEVDRSGRVVWEGTVMRTAEQHGDFYRAIKIASLYRYEVP
jgi:hypothetical protein